MQNSHITRHSLRADAEARRSHRKGEISQNIVDRNRSMALAGLLDVKDLERRVAGSERCGENNVAGWALGTEASWERSVF